MTNRTAAIALTGILVATSACAPAGPAGDILEQARNAVGTQPDGSPTGFVLRAEGVQNRGAEHQGRRPGSLDPGSFEETIAVREDGAVAYEYRLQRDDGTGEWIREIYDAPRDKLIVVRHLGFAVRLRGDEHVDARRRILRRLPQSLLAQQDASVRAESIVVPTSDGIELTVGLDANRRPASVEYQMELPTFGVVPVTWQFSDYRAVDGMGFTPFRYGVAVDGTPFTEMSVTEAGVANVDEWFELPEGIAEPRLVELPGGNAAANVETVEVAPGVYRVLNLRSGFHPWFVDLGDRVVAIDAPAGYPLLNELPAGDAAAGDSATWLSEVFLDQIRATLPDRDVDTVVLTHFHNDHAGGVAAFARAGARVAVPAGYAPGVREFLGGADAALADHPIVAVADSLMLEGSERTLRVIALDATPHTDEMLVVWLEEAELLLVSDVFNPAPLESYPTPEYALTDRALALNLVALGLSPARIQSMHSTVDGTPAHLSRARQ